MKLNVASSALVLLAAVTAVLATPTVDSKLSSRSAPISGTSNGYFYYVSNTGTGNVNYTNGAGGLYSVAWSGAVNFVAGKGWNPGAARTISYTASYSPAAWGPPLFSVYGWTLNPLIEYYILETFGTYNPASAATLVGTVATDGATYGIYKEMMINQPSIIGTATYYRYYSVRQVKRVGGTITTSNHFNAWAASGLQLGSFNFQIVATSNNYLAGASGQATVTITSPGGISPGSRDNVPDTHKL